MAKTRNDNDDNDDRTAAFTRKALLVVGCLYTFLYVGAFFGYGPMQILLEENGHFSSRCEGENADEGSHSVSPSVCPAQTEALINVQFIAQTTCVVSPLLGEIADRYGAATIGHLVTIFTLLGLSCLVMAAKLHVDVLLNVAFVSLALGTWTGSISTVQLGRLYFTGPTQRRVIFGLNALFDASGITYLGLWGISKLKGDGGVSLTVIASGYLGVAVVVLGASSYLWSVAKPIVDENGVQEDEIIESEFSKDINDDHDGASIDRSRRRYIHLDPSTAIPKEESPAGIQEFDAAEYEYGAEEAKVMDGDDEYVDDDNMLTSSVHETTNASSGIMYKYVLVADRTPRQQLTSNPAILLALFFAIHVTANNWTLTTTRDFLAYLDEESADLYLTIFTLLNPASLVAVPFVDAMIGRYGFHGGLQSVNALAISYMAIRVFSNNLNVQVLSFLLFSFYRCFLFGVVYSFLPTLVAGHVIGKASGWMFLIAGITALLNILLTNLAVEHLDGDFFFPNLVYMFLYLPCIALAWNLGQVIQEEAIVKQGGVLLKRKRTAACGLSRRVRLYLGAGCLLVVLVVAIAVPLLLKAARNSDAGTEFLSPDNDSLLEQPSMAPSNCPDAQPSLFTIESLSSSSFITSSEIEWVDALPFDFFGPENSKFGAAVSIDQNVFVSGAPGLGSVYSAILNPNLSTNGGAGGIWNLMSPPLTGGDGFGAAVDLHGKQLVVGAPNGSAAYVYSMNPSRNAWIQIGSNLRGDEDEGIDGFGSAVAIGDSSTSTRIIVGAPSGATGGDSSIERVGRVYTYGGDGSAWNSLERSPILGKNAFDKFGTSVDMAKDGSRFIVGAPGDGSSSGYFQIYEWQKESSRWSLDFEDMGDAAEQFGSSVAILSSDATSSGIVVAVGAPDFQNGAGRVVVYQKKIGTDRYVGQEIIGSTGDRLGSAGTICGGAEDSEGNLLLMLGAASGNVKSLSYNLTSKKWEIRIRESRIRTRDGTRSNLSMSFSGNLLIAGFGANDQVALYEQKAAKPSAP